MSSDRAGRARRRLPRLWVGYAVLWVGYIVFLAAACAPLPVRGIDVTDTVWQLRAIDGKTAQPRLVTVHFHDLERATIESDCFELEVGLVVDPDSQGFRFAGSMERATKDCDDATSWEAERAFEALLGATAWSVVDQRTLELTGEYRVRLVRVD